MDESLACAGFLLTRFSRGWRRTRHVLSVTILLPCNNTGRGTRGSRAYASSALSFFLPRVRDQAREPRQWRDPTVVERRRARGRGYGHGVIKNSLPLAAEVASGNLHLIPGGPLCQPASQPSGGCQHAEKGVESSKRQGFRRQPWLWCCPTRESYLPVGPFSVQLRSASVASAKKKKKKKSCTQLRAAFN